MTTEAALSVERVLQYRTEETENGFLILTSMVSFSWIEGTRNKAMLASHRLQHSNRPWIRRCLCLWCNVCSPALSLPCLSLAVEI
jgi:hypothetical protein